MRTPRWRGKCPSGLCLRFRQTAACTIRSSWQTPARSWPAAPPFCPCGTKYCARRHSGSTGLPRCTRPALRGRWPRPASGRRCRSPPPQWAAGPRPSAQNSARPRRRAPQTSRSPLCRPALSGCRGPCLWWQKCARARPLCRIFPPECRGTRGRPAPALWWCRIWR